MEIRTKYNVGDEVWIMRDNKPEKIRIDGIEVEVKGGDYSPVLVVFFQVNYIPKFGM